MPVIMESRQPVARRTTDRRQATGVASNGVMQEAPPPGSGLEIDPDVPALSDLRGRTVYRPQQVSRLPLERLANIVKGKQGRDLGEVALELTARHPWAPTGYADFYAPGRWDCESDLVYMSAIHQVGASVGEWEGTVGYARFTAPAQGSYIVVVNFSGYQQTMRLNGPWGTSTAHSATTSDSAAATAIWDGAAGQVLYCTFSSRSDSGFAGIAYLDSMQIFTPASS